MIEPQHWRVGEKVPLNVYLNDKPMFQCHTPEAAAMVVEKLNANERLTARVAELEWANQNIGRQLLGHSEAVNHAVEEIDRLREALKGCLNELEDGTSTKLLDRIGAAHAALNPTEPA
jgi:hypothetical protein